MNPMPLADTEQAEITHEKETSRTVEIDKEGDLHLLVSDSVTSDGPQTTACVVVASSILTYHSSMFRSMLADKFQEGKLLAEAGHVSVSLPEDASETVTALCAIMHCRQDLTPKQPGPALLEAILTLSDKWDTLTVVQFHIACWIKECLSESCLNKLGRLLKLAYTLGNQDLFKTICERMAIDSPLHNSVSSLPLGSCDANLALVVEQINSYRKTSYLHLLQAICECVQSHMARPAIKKCLKTSKCQGQLKLKIDNPLEILTDCGFFPMTSVGKYSLTEHLQHVNGKTSFKALDSPMFASTCGSCLRSYFWNYHPLSFFDRISFAVETSYDSMPHFCLTCIQAGSTCDKCREV